MKRKIAIASLLLLIIVGCIPKRYEWSPNGLWITVLSQDGLRIADAKGNLSPAILPGVTIATWFPDSSRLLVSVPEDVASWDDLKAVLTSDQITSIADAIDRVHDFASTYDWKTSGDVDWFNFLSRVGNEEKLARGADAARVFDQWGGAIGLYVRDHDDPALKSKMPAKRWQELSQVHQHIALVESVAFDGQKFDIQQQTAVPNQQNPTELRISPTGRQALVVFAGDNSVCDLWEISLDGQQSPIKLSDSAAWYPDFSPDGRDVYFVRAVGAQTNNNDSRLGSLSRLRVLDDKGMMKPHPDNPDDLVGVLYSGLERVRCLKDGRVIFSSVDVSLPATGGDLPSKPQLYALTPNQPTVTRLLTRKAFESVGGGAWWFELSPDSSHVAIGSETGTIAVVDLTDGSVSQAQSQPMPGYTDSTGSTVTVPSWRNNQQLTFAAPGADNEHWSVQLWTMTQQPGASNQVAGKSINLSATWPPELLTDIRPQPATKP